VQGPCLVLNGLSYILNLLHPKGTNITATLEWFVGTLIELLIDVVLLLVIIEEVHEAVVGSLLHVVCLLVLIKGFLHL
jgi:hypothetical protein